MSYDINTIRIAALLLGLGSFIWLMFWAWSRKRRAAFDDAARLPFQDSGFHEARTQQEGEAR
jgi:cytochrome c oxidase cbb3-type subunit IV